MTVPVRWPGFHALCIERVADGADGHEQLARISETHCFALAMASEQNHVSRVKLLLSKRADVNLVDSSGRTALSYATASGFAELADVLLAHGADATVRRMKVSIRRQKRRGPRAPHPPALGAHGRHGRHGRCDRQR